jgi:predicted enzyme related to lactoylglutathione lyase
MHDVAHFILYVAEQARSTEFYSRVLQRTPRLNVPGMTEFELGGGAVLGLMPAAGIQRLLGPSLPAAANGARAEIYLHVPQVDATYARALAAGAKALSGPQLRNWGHYVGYALDPDEHVLAVACAAPPELSSSSA